jgi:hypothetical protein
VPRYHTEEFLIKELLAQRRDDRGRRLNMAALARLLNEAPGSVAGVIYGHRENPPLRARIAAFLGREAAELFGGPVEETEPENGGARGRKEAGGDLCPNKTAGGDARPAGTGRPALPPDYGRVIRVPPPTPGGKLAGMLARVRRWLKSAPHPKKVEG